MTQYQLLSLSDIDWEASSMRSWLISASYSGSHQERLTSSEQSAVQSALCSDGGSNEAPLKKTEFLPLSLWTLYFCTLPCSRARHQVKTHRVPLQVARFKHCLMLRKAAQVGSSYRRTDTCDTPVFILITLHYITANIRETWYVTDLLCNRMEWVISPIRRSIL